MKRTIAVAVILALGTGIPGPGCYEALAQDRGVQAKPTFESSNGEVVREAVVKPVSLQLGMNTVTAEANLNIFSITNLRSMKPVVRSNNPMVFRFRRMLGISHLPVAQKEIAGEIGSIDAVSTDESRGVEKTSAALGGRKFQTGRFWRAVSQFSVNMDPTQLFDGMSAAMKSLISPQYGGVFSPQLAAAGAGTAGNLQMPVHFADVTQKNNPMGPRPPGWTGNGGLRDSGDRNHDITVLRFNLGLILGSWRAILINTGVNSAQKLNIKLVNYFRENLNDWLVKTRTSQPIQDHIVVFTKYLTQVLSSENWPGANISEYSEAVEKKLDEISAEIGKAKSISDLEKAGLFIASSEGQIEQLNSGSTQISDPTKSLLRIYLRAGLGASLLGASPWFVLWQYYLFGCLAFVCGLTIFTRAFFDCLRWMRLNR